MTLPSQAKSPTISLLIPVFEDDRILRALSSALAQVVPFDEILIQSPTGKYKELEKSSPAIRVLTESDRNLFNALDILVENCTSDYLVMIGSDDFFLDTEFVQRAKACLVGGSVHLYVERSVMAGTTLRVWPPLWLVRARLVLPSHFGTVFNREWASRLKMDRYTDNDILANDSLWLHDLLNSKNIVLSGCNVVSLCMEAGGVSTNNSMSVLNNLRSFLRKSKRNGARFSCSMFRAFIALAIKVLVWGVPQSDRLARNIRWAKREYSSSSLHTLSQRR